jgi:myo-inositol-1(or 4)-monophosphatase
LHDEITALRRLAEEAARRGGSVARRAFGSQVSVQYKSDRSEVTHVDLAAERAVLDFLRRQRPRDAFLSEESHPAPGAGSAAAARLWWVVDPLDGTRNFARGIACFACSISAMADGVPIVGAIYDPLQEVLYSADQHAGSFVNDRPIQRANAAPDGALQADAGPRPGDSLTRKPLIAIPGTNSATVRTMVRECLGDAVVRNFGSAALHLAMVATGQLDAALLSDCKLWDIAAGWLIVRGAGGLATRLDGGPRFPLDPGAYAGDDLSILAAAHPWHARLVAPPS